MPLTEKVPSLESHDFSRGLERGRERREERKEAGEGERETEESYFDEKARMGRAREEQREP